MDDLIFWLLSLAIFPGLSNCERKLIYQKSLLKSEERYAYDLKATVQVFVFQRQHTLLSPAASKCRPCLSNCSDLTGDCWSAPGSSMTVEVLQIWSQSQFDCSGLSLIEQL